MQPARCRPALPTGRESTTPSRGIRTTARLHRLLRLRCPIRPQHELIHRQKYKRLLPLRVWRLFWNIPLEPNLLRATGVDHRRHPWLHPRQRWHAHHANGPPTRICNRLQRDRVRGQQSRLPSPGAPIR